MVGTQGSPFGALLRQFRLSKGLSQEALAERARLSVEAISALERGSRKSPQRQTVALLVDGLGLDGESRERFEAAARRTSRSRVKSTPEAAGAADAAPGVRRHNLSRPLTRFVDREAERAAIRELLEVHRAVTITGTGGVGKTRTAIEACFELLDRYPEGVWIVELAQLNEAALVLQEIASTLEIREVPDRPLLEVIVASLRAKRSLLVLDNCEHVIDEAARAAAGIIAGCPSITVLATSREALRIDGEAVYRLPTLGVPDDDVTLSTETALRYGAIELFVERGSAHDPRFTLTDQNGPAVATICRRLDGIPLALELAAATIPVLSAPQIAERLDERFRLLTGGRRNHLPRQRTLRALIDWSFDLLSEREKTVFRRLAILAGTWTLDAAAAVCADEVIAPEDVPELLVALVEKSLVVAEPNHDGEGRFRFLESTREYAYERLMECGERESVARRHAQYIVAYARRARSSLSQMPETSWVGMVERDFENVRVALAWTIGEQNDVPAGAEIAALLASFWDSRRHQEGTQWLESLHRVLDLLETRLAANVLLESARIQPFTTQTLARIEHALGRYRAITDTVGMYQALTYFGQTLINLGRYDDASAALGEGLALARDADDRAAMGRLLALLGFADLYGGRAALALERLSEADDLARRNARERDAALVQWGFAEAALVTNDAPRAVDLYFHALELWERLGDARRITCVRYLLCYALIAANRVDDALMHAVRSLHEFRDWSVPLMLIETITVVAAAWERKHDDARAARLLGFVQSRSQSIPFRSTQVIRGLQDATAIALSNRLGKREWARLAAEGATWSDEEAAKEAAGR